MKKIILHSMQPWPGLAVYFAGEADVTTDLFGRHELEALRVYPHRGEGEITTVAHDHPLFIAVAQAINEQG